MRDLLIRGDDKRFLVMGIGGYGEGGWNRFNRLLSISTKKLKTLYKTT